MTRELNGDSITHIYTSGISRLLIDTYFGSKLLYDAHIAVLSRANSTTWLSSPVYKNRRLGDLFNCRIRLAQPNTSHSLNRKRSQTGSGLWYGDTLRHKNLFNPVWRRLLLSVWQVAAKLPGCLVESVANKV